MCCLHCCRAPARLGQAFAWGASSRKTSSVKMAHAGLGKLVRAHARWVQADALAREYTRATQAQEHAHAYDSAHEQTHSFQMSQICPLPPAPALGCVLARSRFKIYRWLAGLSKLVCSLACLLSCFLCLLCCLAGLLA